MPETVEPESRISVVNPQVELLALTGFHFEPWDGDGRYGMHSQTLERMATSFFRRDEYTPDEGKVSAGGR